MARRGSVKRRYANTLLHGGLEKFLREQRDVGASWDGIARELWAMTDREIEVTGPTVQEWARELGIDGVSPTSEEAI